MFYLGLYLLIGLIYSILMYESTFKYVLLANQSIKKYDNDLQEKAKYISIGMFIVLVFIFRIFLYPLLLFVDFIIYREVKKMDIG